MSHINQKVDTGRVIRAADASMRMEGFVVSSKVKDECRAMLAGQKTAGHLVSEYVSQYTQNKK